MKKYKKIIVTGASKGLGLKIGISLLKKGHFVIFNYRTDSSNMLEAISSTGSEKYAVLKADLTKIQDVRNFFRRIENDLGSIDILINNIGCAYSGNILFVNIVEWEKTIITNIKSTFICTKYFAKKSTKNSSSMIINIGSLSGIEGKENESAYSTSKSALIGLTKSAAKDLKPFGIKVCLIYPPSVKSSLNRKAFSNEDKLDKYLKQITKICEETTKFKTGKIFNIH